MAGTHLNRELLEQLLAGATPSPEVVEQLLQHNLELCPVCRREYHALAHSLPLPRRTLGQVMAQVLGQLSGRALNLTDLEASAQSQFRELMLIPGPTRRLKINRAFTRFKNPVLAEMLIEASRRQASADPFEAYALAECAHDVALRLSVSDFGHGWVMTCIARSNAYRGNALRATGDFKRAEEILEFALAFFDREGNADPLVEAELLLLIASLRHDQRRFPDAEAHLDMARGLYEECAAWDQIGRLLVQKAILQSEAEELDLAIDTINDAIAHIDPAQDPKLYLCAQHELTHYLEQQGRFEEARQHLEANVPLYQRFPEPWTQLRLQWLTGKIARGLGETEAAEQAFLHVRQRFQDEGLGFDAALAGLDLALVYIEQGRPHKVRELAQDMVPIFLAQDIHREATMALLLFQEAARRETATATMVTELIAYMKRVRRRPVELAS